MLEHQLKIAFIDNFDSFTYNLVHYLQKTGADLMVFRNNELTDENIRKIRTLDAIVVGPGPNSPQDAGNLLEVLKVLIEDRKPILGVCLGHQALGELFGWRLELAAVPVHGKSSLMRHNGRGIFIGLENPMQIGRYHSLVVAAVGVQEEQELEVYGRDELGQVMAFSHKHLPIWGVQFHPESVLTYEGQILLDNWVKQL